MWEIIFKVWYIIAILPFLILIESYSRFKKFLKIKDSFLALSYFILLILAILLVILLGLGYR